MSEEQHAEEEPQGELDPPTQKRAPYEIKFIIPVAYDDTAVDAGAQGDVTPCNEVIKDTVETPEELHAEEEPQESPTPLAFVQAAGQQTIRFTEGSDKTVVNSDLSDAGDEAVREKARAAMEETKETAATVE